MKNRLTYRDSEGRAQWKPELLEDTSGLWSGPMILEKLCAYEGTGLGPEGIAEMKILWDMYGGSDGITNMIIGKAPCDMCRFSPPSSGNGKPCGICPAEVRG